MSDYGQNAIQVGDVLMFHGEHDVGDINENGGIIEMTSMFETMTYLTFFGGNHGDDGSAATTKQQWWGNDGEPEERQYRSRTQNLLSGNPINSASLKLIQEAAQADLEDAFIVGGYADSVEVTVRIIAPKRIAIEDKIILKSGKELRNRLEVSGL
jgi:hypothetical protein